MLVKFHPESQQDPTEWEFDPNKVRQSEAEIIEKRMGTTFQKWVELIQAGDSRARRVLLWVVMRREHHTMRYEDTPDFMLGELELDYSLSDLQRMRGRLLEAAVPDDEKTEILNKIDLEIAARLGKEEVGPEDLGKAPSNSDA